MPSCPARTAVAPLSREIGPGVWDIHSPRVPSAEEMAELLRPARARLQDWRIWVNPDCGLKTREVGGGQAGAGEPGRGGAATAGGARRERLTVRKGGRLATRDAPGLRWMRVAGAIGSVHKTQGQRTKFWGLIPEAFVQCRPVCLGAWPDS